MIPMTYRAMVRGGVDVCRAKAGHTAEVNTTILFGRRSEHPTLYSGCIYVRFTYFVEATIKFGITFQMLNTQYCSLQAFQGTAKAPGRRL